MFDKMKNRQGSALLNVVLIMTVVVLMGSIMLGQGISNIRYIRISSDEEMAFAAAHAGIVRSVEELCRVLDEGEPPGNFTTTENTVFKTAPECVYSSRVLVSGYDPQKFQATEGFRQYSINKKIESDAEDKDKDKDEDMDMDILQVAVESTGEYKGSQKTVRVLIDFYDDMEKYTVTILKCR